MRKLFLYIFLITVVPFFMFLFSLRQAVDLRSSENTSTFTETKPLLFTGDIMLGRYVEKYEREEGNDMRSFKNMETFLKEHTTIANLEGPIPSVHVPTLANGFTFSFSSSTPRVLKDGGVTAVSLANNHMFDHGRGGYEATEQALSLGGVAHFGGYAPTTDDYFEASLGTSTVIVYGITMIATGWDEEQALTVTKKLRKEHPSAHLVAFLHWGDEYVTQNMYQRAFAHRLIDEGVGTIIGSHPHVVQGVEVYKGVPIFYSLGNFIFDQYWRKDLEDGLLVRMEQDKDGYTYTLFPVVSHVSIPQIAEGDDRAHILTRVASQSDDALKAHILEGMIHMSE